MDNNIPKWYIKRTCENSEDVNYWYNKKFNIKKGREAWANTEAIFFCDKMFESILERVEGYVEIDTEYFRQHILQIPSEDSKEIINNSYSIF